MFPFDVSQGVYLQCGFHLVQSGTQSVEQHFRTDHHGNGFAMAQDMEVTLSVEGWVDGHMDDAAHGQGHIDEVPFRAVAAHGHHTVALFDTHLAQAIGQVMGKFIIVV